MGRTFFAGAIDYLSPEYDADELEDMLDDLLLRDFITRQERSTITGETAYRFKHVLIREVAYSGLSKSGRAEYHTRFAEWLRGARREAAGGARAHRGQGAPGRRQASACP
jgi:predicted ATPase